MSVVNPSVTLSQSLADNGNVLLTGIVQQGTYPIKNVLWTRDSGPDYATTDAADWLSQVYELSAGTYIFRFTAYDIYGNSGTGTISYTFGSGGTVVTYARVTNNTRVLGDSMSAHYLATTDWWDYIGTAKGATMTNYAISGVGVRKEAQAFISDNTKGSPIPAVAPLLTMTGFNNVRVTSGQAVRYEAVNAAHRAFCAIQFAKSIHFPYDGTSGTVFGTMSVAPVTADTASSETILLDWGSRTLWHRHNDATQTNANYWNKSSVVANETRTFNLTTLAGEGIAIGTWGCDGTLVSMSRIQVTLDGTVVQTYDPNNRYYTGFSNQSPESFTQDGIVNDAIILSNLSAGTHTIVLTFLDGGKRGALDYFAVLNTPSNCASVPVYINDVPHCSNAAGIGYNYPGYLTTQVIIDGATSSRTSALQTAFPNYPICFININAAGYYDPTDSAQVNSDGIHPTNLGQQNIANAVLPNMQ